MSKTSALPLFTLLLLSCSIGQFSFVFNSSVFYSGWELLKDPIGATVQLFKNFTLLSEIFWAVSVTTFGKVFIWKSHNNWSLKIQLQLYGYKFCLIRNHVTILNKCRFRIPIVPRRLFFAAQLRIAITWSPNYYQKMQRSITRKNQKEYGPDVK